MGLKLNGTLELLVYADDVNLLGERLNTIKKTTEAPTEGSKEAGLEVNTEKTKYIIARIVWRLLQDGVLD
jgi:hypothetical protein